MMVGDFVLDQIDLGNFAEVNFVFETRSHPEVCKYLIGKPPATLGDHKRWLSENVPEKRLMFLLKVDGVCVGYCHAYDFIAKDTVEVGFVVHPDYQGRGYGKAMVNGLTRYLRREMPKKRIILYVRVGNDRAALLYEKSGFCLKCQIWDSFLYEL